MLHAGHSVRLTPLLSSLLTAQYAVNHQILLTFWVNSDIMFPAAGDGCFYVGLGGKSKMPSPSYEPYQCCPRSSTKQSKVPKMSPAPKAKQVTSKPSRPAIPAPPTPKPFTTARKDAKTPSPLPRKPHLPKFPWNHPKTLQKRKTCWLSQKRERAKRAFSAPVNIFGGGSYRNLIDNCSMMKRENLQDGQYVWSQRSTTVYPTIHWLSISPLFLRLMSETFLFEHFFWA